MARMRRKARRIKMAEETNSDLFDVAAGKAGEVAAPVAQEAPAVQDAAPAASTATASAAAPKRRARPKLFFDKDEKILVTVAGYHSVDTGELVMVQRVDDEDSLNEEPVSENYERVIYKFWFTRCNYAQLNVYRSRCMTYNEEDGTSSINHMRLREFFLVLHLDDWNLTDDDGKKIELRKDPNRSLTTATLDMVYSLPATLIDTVLSAYEDKVVI